tara:strand:- start:1240 stop:1488 length:249 start_codon:yes stop_codon:yes gene_type:complete
MNKAPNYSVDKYTILYVGKTYESHNNRFKPKLKQQAPRLITSIMPGILKGSEETIIHWEAANGRDTGVSVEDYFRRWIGVKE